jgi:2-polyprenyl-6-methoxyphenol hydroxylase-like FAD-dependent oxidoreductase
VSEAVSTPVLIVGGGPVGLALAVLLDRFGIDHVVVERAPATTDHPKARNLTARSMELFRILGLEERIRARSLRYDEGPVGASLAFGQIYCESGTGRILGETRAQPNVNAPSPKVCVAQDVVEEALAEAASSAAHTRISWQTELVSFENGPEGVTAVLRDVPTGQESRVAARYLVACDGASSGVRAQLRVPLEGPGLLQQMVSYYYRADLGHLPHASRWTALWIIPSDPGVPFGPIVSTEPEGQRWIFIHYLENDEAPPLDEDELFRTIRAHWGIPELEIELINMVRWRMQGLLPTSFRRDSVLLAGDAAHAIPPTGGVGLNTGLADAHCLAWKLAFVLRGAAGESLLDTYELERRPAAAAAIAWATENRVQYLRTQSAAERRHEDPDGWRAALIDVNRAFDSDGLSMGWIYEQGALIDDGSPVPSVDAARYWPTDRPGARFPHLWVDAERTESTIDWFDTAFVLVCGPDADGWCRAGELAAAESSAPLVVRRLPWLIGPLSLERDGALLVRPDGHVAWRPEPGIGDPLAALKEAFATVLGKR